jgi:hypothetical protein
MTAPSQIPPGKDGTHAGHDAFQAGEPASPVLQGDTILALSGRERD